MSKVRTWATAAMRDLVYLGAVFAWSIAAFTVLVTGVSVTATLLVLVIGVFVWIGFAYVMRWTTWVDRRLAGWQRNESVPAVYRRPDARGLMPLLKTVSTDPQTRKDFAWAGMNSVAGFSLGLVALTAATVAAACVTMPLWYWAINDPHSHYGITNLGLFTVDSVGNAFAAFGIGIVLVPVALFVARGAASAHSALAARVLAPTR
jgi:hypothetical protein